MKPICAPWCVLRPAVWAGVLSCLAALVGRGEPNGSTNASPPSIVVEPRSQTVLAGDYARFEVGVAGSVPLSYQWQTVRTNVLSITNIVDGSPVVTTSNVVEIADVPLATYSAYYYPGVGTNMNGGYRVVVTNSAGGATSVVASLTVLPSAPRELVLEAYTEPLPGRVALPLRFWANGDERQLSASLAFSTAVLANPEVTLDPLLTNVTLTTDATEVGLGRLGLKFQLPGGTNALAGVYLLGEVRFDLLGIGGIAGAGLAWGSHPVPLQALDATNAPLTLQSVIYPHVVPSPWPPVFNRQSGLFTQELRVVNPTAAELLGAPLYVYGLTNDSRGTRVTVRNAADPGVYQPDATPPVFLAPSFDCGPVAAGGSRLLTAEFFLTDRGGNAANTWTLPLPIYEASVAQPTILTPSGTLVPTDEPRFVNGAFLIDFVTLTNNTYYVQYNWKIDDTNAVWQTAVPGVRGTGARVQWMDNGPPKTITPPTGTDRRFYRVIVP